MAKKLQYFGNRKSSELKASETEKIDRYKERFNKWHTKQIDLLTFSINLVFTISIAFLGFIIDMLSDKCSSGEKGILIVMGIIVTLGILALISRLNDFRVTKNITKSRRRIYELENKIQYEDIEASDLDQLKNKLNQQSRWTNILGKSTWILFYLQIASLLLAFWMLILQ
jgi:hypothetical protein